MKPLFLAFLLLPILSPAQPAIPPPDDWESVTKSILEFVHVVRVTTNGMVCESVEYNNRTGEMEHVRYMLLKRYPGEAGLVGGDHLVNVMGRRVGREDIQGETSAVYDCGARPPRLPTAAEISAAKDLAQRQKEAAASRKSAADLATFRFHYERATNGIASSQLRLAELYAAGIGCEKDTNVAAAWRAAAATNSPSN
jgi:hypothetical protein